MIMKISNVAHYVSVAGRHVVADNIHFLIEGAKLEALASNSLEALDQKRYKQWLDMAECKKPIKNKHSEACEVCEYFDIENNTYGASCSICSRYWSDEFTEKKVG